MEKPIPPLTPDDKVILAVASIYQAESGRFIEDEAADEFLGRITASYEKHKEHVTDESALIDRILEDLRSASEGDEFA